MNLSAKKKVMERRVRVMKDMKLAKSTFLVPFSKQLLFNQVKIVCLWVERLKAVDERANERTMLNPLYMPYHIHRDFMLLAY